MSEERIERMNETDEERHLRHKMERQKRREKKRKKAAVVAFIMSLAMIIEIVAVGLFIGFYSKGSSDRFSRHISEYSVKAYELVIKRVEALSTKYGLPNSVYEEVITQDRVTIALEAFANDLSEIDYATDVATEDISKTISENVRTHLNSIGVKIDDAINENTNNYTAQCVNYFKNTLIFSHFRIIRQLKMYLFYFVVTVSIICMTIIAICLILIYRYTSRKRQMLRYMIYSVGTTWIVTFIPAMLIYSHAIPIYLKGMKFEFQFELIMNYFYNSVHYLLSASYLLFALYIILTVTWYYIALNKKSHI